MSYFEAVTKYKQQQLLPKKHKKSLSRDIVHNIHYEKNDTIVNAPTVCCHIVLGLGDSAPKQGRNEGYIEEGIASF